MSQKKYFSYIRVSTQRQGQHGTSLAEQQAAIERFAGSWNLPIVKRFEERETAAKQGRPVFLEMLKQLKSGHAHGVIIHKIDRSARNLKDWADLGSLIDRGLEVRFASESLDLNSRGGRLSADIQAVVASDYVRNLSEEAKKGLYGRLKQGLYPFRAMIGYLDRGPGKPKAVDSLTAPLIRRAFELYATGDWGLVDLTDEMNRSGLRTKSGKKLTRTGLAWILHNPFYFGVIHIKKTGERFVGIHEPIVTRALFDQVQQIFKGKNIKKASLRFYNYRRLIKCSVCAHFMSPEIQKGITYYRCHTRGCVSNCLKEETIMEEIKATFKRLTFSDYENVLLRELAKDEGDRLESETSNLRESAQLQLSRITDRHSRLADAYMSGVFDEAIYLQKKNELVMQEQALKEKLMTNPLDGRALVSQLEEFFELANSAYLSYISADASQQRYLVSAVTSNLTSNGKSLSIKLKTPFDLIAVRTPVQYGCPYREATRTISAWVSQFLKIMQKTYDLDLDDTGIKK